MEQRKGNPPDGAMLVKEQYVEPRTLWMWTIMVKDSKGSHDGWYWADLSPSSPSSSNAPVDSDDAAGETAPPQCPQASYPSIGFGEYCLNCHASARVRRQPMPTRAM